MVVQSGGVDTEGSGWKTLKWEDATGATCPGEGLHGTCNCGNGLVVALPTWGTQAEAPKCEPLVTRECGTAGVGEGGGVKL